MRKAWFLVIAFLLTAAPLVRAQEGNAGSATTPPATMFQSLPLSAEGAKEADAFIARIQAEIKALADKERVAYGLTGDWQIDLQSKILYRRVPVNPKAPEPQKSADQKTTDKPKK